MENKELNLEQEPVKKAAARKPAYKEAIEEQNTGMGTFIDPRERLRQEVKMKIAQEREMKSKMVTGKFLFNECPGGELVFYYREFPGDELVKYKMRHDSIQTIPLGVAQHLNDRCSYPEYQHNMDNGKSIDASNMYIMTKVHRTSFIPLDFTVNAGNYAAQSIAMVSYKN